MQEFNFSFTLEEANEILAALGNMPYAKVYQLIGKIQHQANAQLNPADEVVSEGTIIEMGEQGQMEPEVATLN